MNRATLAKDFAASTSRDSWKTFVLEAHPENGAEDFLRKGFGPDCVEPTEDIHLHRLRGEADFVVDHLNDRFWSFHTTQPIREVTPFLRDAVSSQRLLDWMWLPSDHLSGIWENASLQWLATDFRGRRLSPSKNPVDDLNIRVRGQEAGDVLNYIADRYQTAVPHREVGIAVRDDELGWVNEGIDHRGRFVANGDDFSIHQAIVRRVIDRYRDFVEAVEQHLLRWEELPQGGARLRGVPIEIEFSRDIPDVGRFAENLFSSREPFRLWGLYDLVGDDLAEVEAVDLHVGQQLRFDITTRWLRVYLYEGGCGNTVARLVSNLQRSFDGALSMVNEDLQALLKPGIRTQS